MLAVATAPSQSREGGGEAALGAAALADPSGLLPHCPSPACLLLNPQPSSAGRQMFLSSQEHIPSISWARGGVKCCDPRPQGSWEAWGVQGCRSEAGLAEGPGAILSCGVLNS